jgi:Zn-dependent protease with chaperone function
MNPTVTTSLNPTTQIDLDFANFVAGREESNRRHFHGAVTDYCFSMDLQLRQKLAAIKPLQLAAKAALSFTVLLQKQIMSMQGVAVGPNQYPHIYAMAQSCAERLGIGIPQVFIKFDPTMNAYTLAAEGSGDMIVVHSALVEALTAEELLFVIGHECGHIHNQHCIYNTIGQILANVALREVANTIPGGALIFELLKQGVGLFLNSWFRCSELTADRAGLICSGNLDAGRYALAKLETGGGPILKNVNLDALVKQLDTSQATPVRLYESSMSHPIAGKRLECLRIFRQCEVLYTWRPEMRGDQPGVSKEDTDRQCEQIARVFVRKGN